MEHHGGVGTREEAMEFDMLSAVRSRTKSYGISTAAPFLRQLEQCLGGHCPSSVLKGVSQFRWQKALENAERQLVYNNPEMGFDGEFLIPGKSTHDIAGLPPHTAAMFSAVITTTRQDRDGDVLETSGAELDPSAPLLWQHLPFEPIGGFYKDGKQTKNRLTGSFTICGTPLGEDAAMLAEHGALDISHGFTTDDYEPLDDKKYDIPGIHVLKFKILEVSLVSIPSNPDAEITAFSRNKLHHPLVKAMAGVKYDNRPVVSAVGIDVAALANAMPAGSTLTLSKATEPVVLEAVESKTAACGCKSHAEQASTTVNVKSVVPYKKTPASDSSSWDADSAVSGLRKWAGVDGDEPSDAAFSKYKQGFGIVDGEASNLTSYKYPHHEASDGKLTVNRKALGAVVAALNGGRGGTSLSESDRKGLYNHIAKHYRDSFPDDDVPELKCVEPLRYKGQERDFYNPHKSLFISRPLLDSKGVYVEFENSFDDIRCDLNDSLLSFLMMQGEADSDDFCYIVDLFLYQAIVQVCERSYFGYGPYDYCMPMDDEHQCYYLIDWEMGPDEEPVWTGTPQPIEIKPQIVELSERAFEMFVKSMPAKHMRAMKKAMGHCSAVVEHKDATDVITDLGNKAYDAIKSVHDAHDEKAATMPAEHMKKLDKAMGYCSKGMDHADATDGIKGYFKSAHAAVKSVIDDMDGMSGEESLETLIYKQNKAGRRVSVANEKKLKSAAMLYKAIASDDEADGDVAKLALNGYEAVTDIFETGGDSANDYDAEGNYTGNDMHANMANGQSTNLPDGKAGRAISKDTGAKIQKAIGHGEAIVSHEKAGDDHKALAKKAVTKLKAVLGEETPHEQGDDNSMNLVTQDEPAGKSLKELCEAEYRSALADMALTGTLSALENLAAVHTEAGKNANDTISRIQRQRQWDAEQAVILSAAASV